MDSFEEVKRLFEITPEQEERLKTFVHLLCEWQKIKNLVGTESLKSVWQRHIADSLQPHFVLPEANRWVDFGSGAGFPGIVSAIMLASRPDAAVHLIESNTRKAAFLKTVVRETDIPAKIVCGRIEDLTKKWNHSVDAVSARALAPLDKLCAYAEGIVSTGAKAVFHKGKNFLWEIEIASKNWHLDLVKVKSLTDRNSVILVISKIEAKHH